MEQRQEKRTQSLDSKTKKMDACHHEEPRCKYNWKSMKEHMELPQTKLQATIHQKGLDAGLKTDNLRAYDKSIKCGVWQYSLNKAEIEAYLAAQNLATVHTQHLNDIKPIE